MNQYLDSICAIVLSGGESKRMGKDKSQIIYHQELAHELYTARLCSAIGLSSYISKAHNSRIQQVEEYDVINDFHKGIGPIAAIHAAFNTEAQKAWLAISCDFPFISEVLIRKLLTGRNEDKLATILRNKNSAILEPLLAIYEPGIRPFIDKAIQEGQYGLQRLLLSLDVEIIDIQDELLLNANTKDQQNQAREILRNNADF